MNPRPSGPKPLALSKLSYGPSNFQYRNLLEFLNNVAEPVFLPVPFKFLGVKLLYMDRTAVLIRRGEKFLLTKNSDEGSWSPVMATVERGETLRETARRETRNKAEIEVDFVEKVTRNSLEETNELHWYLAEEKQVDEEDDLEPQEIEETSDRKWFELDELMELELEALSNGFFEEHREKLLD